MHVSLRALPVVRASARGRGIGATAAVLVVVLLVALPTGTVGSRVPSPVRSVPPTAGTAGRLLPHPATTSALPGSIPSSRVVNGPFIYREYRSHPFDPGNGTAGNGSTASPPPALDRLSLPGRGSVPGTSDGWITGTVLDSLYQTPVVGANVTPSGCFDPSCEATTNASGFFRLALAPGPTSLGFSDPVYLPNTTTGTVVAGSVVSVGIVLLVHDATVTGSVVADLPGLPGLANISVTSISRDGELIGPTTDLTPPNGSFSLEVDPFALEVDFVPTGQAPPGYVGNATFVDPTPWQVLDVGPIRLEGGVPASVSVVDSTNGLPVDNVTAEFCSDRIDGACFGVDHGNGTATVATVAGPGFFAVAGAGYETNVTQAPDIPAGTMGPVPAPAVALVPDGFVEVTVNFTGGTPNGSWEPSGGFGFLIIACALSGGQNDFLHLSSPILPTPSCVGTPAQLGQTVLAAAPPLRDAVYVVPGYSVPNGMPLAERPIPQFPLTFYANLTWANVTPDRVTDLGTMGVLPGTYLAGSVTVGGSLDSVVNGSVSVQACSTVRAALCDPGVTTGAGGQSGPIPSGCSAGPWTFCAPSPPGPIRLTIGWGPASNATWVDVPYTCCSQQGRPTEVGSFGLFADVGAVHGTLGIEGLPTGSSPTGGWVAEVEACPAVPGPLPCFYGSSSSGSNNFSIPAPLGWDLVTATAVDYRINRTWIDVTGNNSTGDIELAPYGAVSGRIVSAATGAPVLESFVQACNVANDLCLPGWEETNSNGTFEASFPTFPYPGGTFQIEVSASGFDPESTFANVTAGEVTNLTTLRLPPVGLAGDVPVPEAAHPAGSSTPTTGSWVTGRLVDAVSGLGVGAASISVCQLRAAGGCVAAFYSTLPGGEFNLTTVHGAYEIWFNATHYPSDVVYLNATTAGTVGLGNIELTPLPRLVGRVLVGPWGSLGPAYGEGADQTLVEVCTKQLVCGSEGVANSAGFFNVSAPSGTGDLLTFTGGGPGGWGGNGLPGFTTAEFPQSIGGTITRLNSTGPGGAFLLSILGGVAAGVNETGGPPTRPAMFVTYGAVANVSGATLAFPTGAGGGFVAFLPAGASQVVVSSDAIGLVPATSAPSNGSVVAGVVVADPTLTETRFGFVTAEITDASGAAPLGNIPMGAYPVGGTNPYLSGNDISNGTGAINVSAPPGADTLGINTSAYAPWTGNITVAAGEPAAFGSVELTALADGGVTIVRTEQVNTVSGPIVPGVYDPVAGRPVPGAGVTEGALGIHAGPLNDSDLGEFFFPVVPDALANLTVVATGFSPLTFGEDLVPGETVVVQPVNLTAGGIVTGTVVAEPGNVTVPYATVLVCPIALPTCQTTVETNATGVFWVGAPSGYDVVSVVSNAYLTNLSRIVAVTPDGFVELGNVPVFGFGTVRGVTLGLPSGTVLPDVNVSLCSEFSPPAGCLPDESVTTDANGSFSIESPPGVYFFYAALPGYNSTRFELVLGPGVDLDLGVVVLQAYGVESGTVVTPTGAPVPNATVFSCASYSGGNCAGPSTTNATGEFLLVAPPGPNDLTVSAAGYLDSVVRASVPPGRSVSLGPIVLTPQPPDVFENITGTVTESPSGAVLPGAFVVAEEGGARVAQTETRGNGFYDLIVRWGTPTVFVGIPGFRSANATVVAHANVTGLDFSLPTMVYAVRGVAFDGGTGTVLGGATIEENGTVVGTTAANGAFDLALPNGTTSLVGTHPPVGAVEYATVRFSVTVTGGATVHDLTIPRSVVPLSGVVVDASTGVPIPAAEATLWTPEGATLSNGATSGTGAFAFAVTPGRYNVSVTAPGYAPANVSVSTGGAGNHTTVALFATPSGGARSAGGFPSPVVAAAAAALVVALGAVVVLRRRRPPGVLPAPAPPE